MKKRRKKGTCFIILGLLLITAALLLQSYNLWDGARAERDVASALKEWNQRTAGAAGDDYIDPNTEMPEIVIDGASYIGTVSIPCLELELPVMSQWSYPGLKKAPCRYTGSAYRGDLIVAAHNYKSHFGLLKNIAIGEDVFFTDAVGNRFHYTVSDIEQLNGTAVEEMESGDWDLTLFTCTKGGRARVTVRCSFQ